MASHVTESPTFKSRLPMHCPPLVAAAFALAMADMPQAGAAQAPTVFIEYQGRHLEVPRACVDDNDAESLNKSQVARIESALRKARVGPTFKSADELAASLERLRFPCTGSFYANQLGAHIDPKLEIAYVEIPKRGLNRHIVAEVQPDGTLRVVDDFVASSTPEIARVRRNARGKLEFHDLDGKIARVVRR